MTDSFCDALTAYLDDDHPVPHALLVRGPWGAGKSTALRAYFDISERPKIWVSLFGLTSAIEIEERVIAAVLPGTSGLGTFAKLGVGAIAGKAAATEIGKLADDARAKAAKVLSENRPYVFDDLERFEGDLSAALGYLNLLTEEAKRRVIVVANEAELSARTDADWDRRAEKLIGRRVTVRADAEAVLDGFAESRTKQGPVQKLLEAERETILDTFRQSGTDNLRSLSWALENLARVWTGLDALTFDLPNHAVVPLVTQVIAFTLEHRAGRLGDAEREMLADDMSEITRARSAKATFDNDVHIRGRKTDPDPIIAETANARGFLDRYKTMGLLYSRYVMDFATLFELEANGILDASTFEARLKSLGLEKMPSHTEQLFHWHSLEAEDLTAAIKNAAEELSAQRITDVIELGRLADVALHLESLGDTRLIGQNAALRLRRYFLKRACEGSLTGHPIPPGWMRRNLAARPPEDARTSRERDAARTYERVLDTLERAARYQFRREAANRAKTILTRAMTDGPSILSDLNPEDWDPHLHGYPILNQLKHEAIASLAARSVRAKNNLAGLLTSRDSKARDMIGFERCQVGRILIDLCRRIRQWPDPLGKYHEEQIYDLARHLHAWHPFPNDLLADLNLPHPGKSSDPSP